MPESLQQGIQECVWGATKGFRAESSFERSPSPARKAGRFVRSRSPLAFRILTHSSVHSKENSVRDQAAISEITIATHDSLEWFKRVCALERANS